MVSVSIFKGESAKTGVEEYEGMEVDDEGGPGPQRCKYKVL